jgi:hypothetical protein
MREEDEGGASQKVKDDNFIDYRDLNSPRNSAVRTKMQIIGLLKISKRQ